MKTYTKKGDAGETSLFGGNRVPKDSLRIETYGTLDELNSGLGLARALKPSQEIDSILAGLQNELFVAGADLATPEPAPTAGVHRIDQDHIARLEKLIDTLDVRLSSLKSFIIPGGSPVAAQLHVSRTICRRAERLAVKLSRQEDVGPSCIAYLNRLSDLLFVLARYSNYTDGIPETRWVPPHDDQH